MNACKVEGHDWERQGTYSKCKLCGKVKRNAAPSVRVKRVIQETGELIEQTVPAGHFKPEKPPGVSGEFREKVLAGDRPGLIFDGEQDCPLEPGQEIALTPNVSIFVFRITKTKGGDHRCRYQVIDMRATLPRRTPPMHEPPETDEFGYPIEHSKEAIAAATVDGNYCQGSGQAVPDVGEEVGVQYQRVLGVRKRMTDAEAVPGEEVRRKQERAAREKLRETLKGLDPAAQMKLLAKVEQVIDEAKEPVSA